MGKKAVGYLLDVLLLVFTVLLALAAIVGGLAARIDPNTWWLPSLFGLFLMPLVAANIFMLLVWLLRRKWISSLVPLAAVLLNGGFILATVRVSFSGKDELPHELKVATYNIHRFGRSNYRITADNVAWFMRENSIDILCLQEFAINDRYNLDSLKTSFYTLPHVYVPMLENGKEAGIAVFSAFPILDHEYIPFPGTDNKALRVDLDVNGTKVRLFNGHLQTTSLSYSWREISQLKKAAGGILTEEQEEALDILSSRLRDNACKRAGQANIIHERVRESDCPVIVCGDFNDTPASYTYRRIKSGLRDGFTDKGRGYGYTFRNVMSLLRIDYIMYSDEFRGVRYESPQAPWSDHNLVFMSLDLHHGFQ